MKHILISLLFLAFAALPASAQRIKIKTGLEKADTLNTIPLADTSSLQGYIPLTDTLGKQRYYHLLTYMEDSLDIGNVEGMGIWAQENNGTAFQVDTMDFREGMDITFGSGDVRVSLDFSEFNIITDPQGVDYIPIVDISSGQQIKKTTLANVMKLAPNIYNTSDTIKEERIIDVDENLFFNTGDWVLSGATVQSGAVVLEPETTGGTTGIFMTDGFGGPGADPVWFTDFSLTYSAFDADIRNGQGQISLASPGSWMTLYPYGDTGPSAILDGQDGIQLSFNPNNTETGSGNGRTGLTLGEDGAALHWGFQELTGGGSGFYYPWMLRKDTDNGSGNPIGAIWSIVDTLGADSLDHQAFHTMIKYDDTVSYYNPDFSSGAVGEVWTKTVDGMKWGTGIAGGADGWGSDVVNHDLTMLGDGTSGNILKVDTSEIATQYDLTLVGGGSSLTQEEVEDFAFDPARHGSGTQSLITVAYDDANNQVDYTVEPNLSNYTNDAGFLTSGDGNDNGVFDVNNNNATIGITTAILKSGTLDFDASSNSVNSTFNIGGPLRVTSGHPSRDARVKIKAHNANPYGHVLYLESSDATNRSNRFIMNIAVSTTSYSNIFDTFISKGTLASPGNVTGPNYRSFLFRGIYYASSSWKVLNQMQFTTGSEFNGTTNLHTFVSFITTKKGATAGTTNFTFDGDDFIMAGYGQGLKTGTTAYLNGTNSSGKVLDIPLGTDNQIFKMNGAVPNWETLTSGSEWTRNGADIYPNNTSDIVGIGNTNPSEELHITATTPTILLEPSGTGQAFFRATGSVDATGIVASWQVKNNDSDISGLEYFMGEVDFVKNNASAAGSQIDFRVQGTNSSTAFPTPLSIVGDEGLLSQAHIEIDAGIQYPNTLVKDVAYTLNPTDYIVYKEAGSAVTYTIPDDSTCPNAVFVIVNFDTETLTISRSGTDLIDGATSITLADGSTTPQKVKLLNIKPGHWITL